MRDLPDQKRGSNNVKSRFAIVWPGVEWKRNRFFNTHGLWKKYTSDADDIRQQIFQMYVNRGDTWHAFSELAMPGYVATKMKSRHNDSPVDPIEISSDSGSESD